MKLKIDVVKLLLDAGANVHANSRHSGSALHTSTHGNEIEIVKMLIAAGAEVNAKGGDYGSVLQAAASSRGEKEGKIETVKLLLDAGAEVNTQGGLYGGALQAAIKHGATEIVGVLVTAGTQVNAHGRYYSNALQTAARYNVVQSVKLLIDRGADINISDHEGRSAIYYAALKGNIKAYDELIATGICNLNVQNRLGKTVLDCICISESVKMLKTFLDMDQHRSLGDSPPSVWSPLHWACRTGTFEFLEMLNNTGFHTWVVETKMPAAKWTPLDIGVYYRNPNLVSDEGELLRGCNWRSLRQSGTVLDPTSGHGDAILHRENLLRCSTFYSHEDGLCKGCFSVREF